MSVCQLIARVGDDAGCQPRLVLQAPPAGFWIVPAKVKGLEVQFQVQFGMYHCIGQVHHVRLSCANHALVTSLDSGVSHFCFSLFMQIYCWWATYWARQQIMLHNSFTLAPLYSEEKHEFRSIWIRSLIRICSELSEKIMPNVILWP